jgi:hypothetical protein
MDFSNLYQTIIDSAAVIITAFVGMGVVYVKGYISKRIENEELKNSILLSMTTIENSVKSSIQNLSVEGKKAVADGVISQQELKTITDSAIEHFKKQVSPALQDRLTAHVGDIESFITNKITAELQKADKVTG